MAMPSSITEAEVLAVSEKYRFKNVAISGIFCREGSNLQLYY